MKNQTCDHRPHGTRGKGLGPKRCGCRVLVPLAGCLSLAGGVEAIAVPSVEYDPVAGRVSLSAHNDPMEAVLAALADVVGCTLTARADLSVPMTLRLNQATLSRALDRVLSDHDYVLLYQDGRPSELKVYARGAVPAKGAQRPDDKAGSATRLRNGVPEGFDRPGRNSPLTRADSTRLEKARKIKRIQQGDDPKDVDTLIAALDTVDSAGTRMGVLRALGEAGDARAVPPLMSVLASAELTSPEKVAAVRALGMIDADEARAALEEIAEGDDMAAKVAAQTLKAP